MNANLQGKTREKHVILQERNRYFTVYFGCPRFPLFYRIFLLSFIFLNIVKSPKIAEKDSKITRKLKKHVISQEITVHSYFTIYFWCPKHFCFLRDFLLQCTVC